jgi:type I restriction enzyme R subunit
MSPIGQNEKKTQDRVVKLFQNSLGYQYLGDWKDRSGNANLETELLRTWLSKQGHTEDLISRALYIFGKAVTDTGKSIYDRNHAVYGLMRYGIEVRPDIGENKQTVFLIDWKHPEKNHFAIAEEVTIPASNAKAYTKRPDIVLYVNGIALGVLELKRSTVSVSEGIRQNLDNQKKEFIQPFFSTIQILMAGNDTEGLRYASIETKEKYWLDWKEDSQVHNLLDRALLQICAKPRLLEIFHDFIVYDAGTKKL